MNFQERFISAAATVGFLSPLPTASNGDGRLKVHLNSGHAYVGLKPTVVSCMLGSCVEVCLWDSKLKIGGAVHYLLPGDPGVASQHSGVHGIGALIARMGTVGVRARDMVGKIYGGACVLQELRGNHIGQRNIATARACLRQQRIDVIEENLGGNQGRKVIFFTDTGETHMRLIGQ